MKKKVIKTKKTDSALKTYRERRNLEISPEPKGGAHKRTKKEPIFTIQKHDASHLHYDLRLEIDGVMPSWAVPKGPSLNPEVKRLAIQTDDHPLEYATFEGIIPEGSYGAGTVMVWDIGTYENLKEVNGKKVPMHECLEQGRIEVFLKGTKLYGGFALIKTAVGWLLIKERDEYASARKNPVATQNKSALTKRTMHQIRTRGKE
jgi:DNA ligase D-like protein (predicted 3'-phosphoesterase)